MDRSPAPTIDPTTTRTDSAPMTKTGQGRLSRSRQTRFAFQRYGAARRGASAEQQGRYAMKLHKAFRTVSVCLLLSVIAACGPAGFRSQRHPFELLDSHGTVVARGGEDIELGGGLGPADHRICMLGKKEAFYAGYPTRRR